MRFCGMTWIKHLILCALLLVGIGCASTEWQAEEIPYPASTPFDSNQFARAIYLEGFRQGYRSEMFGDATTVDMLSGPNLQARRLGFYAGLGRARAEKESPRPAAPE